MRILVTRPQPGAAQTAAALQARGHEPIVAPLFQIEILSKVDPKAAQWAAILITSANALPGILRSAGRSAWRGVPIFAVGDRTAQAAREAGFTNVTSAAGNVNDLIGVVAAQLKPPARLLYLGGEERTGDLAGALQARNFAVDTVVVYRFLIAPILPEPAAAALASDIEGALHFSRRGAEAFLNAARNSRLLEAALTKPVHFCMSEQVAAPLRQAGAMHIQIAARPNEDALVELCGQSEMT
ncbi:MAG TPA: uroporphyrinogen-III synthase [Xanthobacteraceae bacterium]|nr:uroporphyrinogen-III synthase [Xanthobacteraceae bacterium]